MYTIKLLAAFFKVNLQQALAYRADTLLNIVMNLLWLVWELVSLQIIFTNTSDLSGWGMGELIALLGRVAAGQYHDVCPDLAQHRALQPVDSGWFV
jgi:ABC-type uncharacterized transport system permease subunit